MLVVAIAASALVVLLAAPASATLSEEAFEACLLERINDSRVDEGLNELEMALDLNPLAREWSEYMATHNDFRHMTPAERDPILPDGTYTWGENIAGHGNRNLPECSQIHSMFMSSSGHLANILSANKDFVSLGAHNDSSGWWVTELFFSSNSYVVPGWECETCVTDIDRWFGQDRYETAVEISKAGFPSGSDAVIIATGLNHPDALAAAPLATRIDAPLLLVRGGSVPSSTLLEVRRLSPDRIYILGGTAAVPSSAQGVLDDVAPVTRLAGADRYETAVKISRATHSSTVDTLYVTAGTSFVEPLAAGPVAAVSQSGLLLVKPDSIPGVVANEISRLSPSKIVVVGGGVVVSQAVVNQLSAYAPTVQSISGSNRYHTSVLVSRHGFPSGADTVLIATGTIFPDALSGGGVAGDLDAPILLLEPGSLPFTVADELRRLNLSTVRILGGPAAVSSTVLSEIASLLG